MTPGSKTRVLLVEDNPGDVVLVREYLKDVKQGAQFDLHSCHRLDLALDYVRSDPVDVVLLDLGLPDSDGLDTFARMYEHAPDLPVIIFTGLDDAEYGAAAVRAGATDFLTKGRIDSDRLARAIRYSIERKRAERGLREAEAKYRQLFERSLAGVYVTTVGGAFVDCNSAFAQMLGFASPRDLLKTRAEDLYANPSDRERFLDQLKQDGAVTDFEILLRRRDGASVWTIENARLLTDRDGNPSGIEGAVIDISERKGSEARRELVATVLAILNRPNEWAALIHDILQTIKASTQLDAVGIRLKRNGDYPYTVANGFPTEFLATESSICAYDDARAPILDAAGQPVLECMCGIVIRGRTDPSYAFFTNGGSFWTNSTTDLLASTTEENRQAATRNVCNAFGYESVALIPVRSKGEIAGLLQLNDRSRGAFDPEMIHFFEGLAASIGVAYTRQQTEERIRHLLNQTTRVNRLALEFGSAKDIGQVYRTAHEQIRDVMDATSFIISLYDEKAGLLRAGYAVFEGKPFDVSALPPIPLERKGHGTQSEVIHTGEPLYLPDFRKAREHGTTEYTVNDAGNVQKGPPPDEAGDIARSALFVPLRVAGKTIGVMQVQSYRLDGYGAEDAELLSGLANVTAVAMQNAQLVDHVARDADVLRASLEGTIRALADTTEMRDPYTAGHQRRVAELSVAIAENLGLSDHCLATVRLAARVHDIGKISIPAEILSKPGKLTNVEFDLVKAHARNGYDILSGIDFPWPIADVVLQHHERMDGSGYPNGVQGGEILAEARILAVADVIEAMANHRPYRPALGIVAALEEIEKCKGDLYDSAVTDACITLFREKCFTFSE